MDYRSLWLTKAELARIEEIGALPMGTLREDERYDGTKLPGAYIRNTIFKIQDRDLRDRAEFAILSYVYLSRPSSKSA